MYRSELLIKKLAMAYPRLRFLSNYQILFNAGLNSSYMCLKNENHLRRQGKDENICANYGQNDIMLKKK